MNIKEFLLAIEGFSGDCTKIMIYPYVKRRLRIDEYSLKDQEYIHWNSLVGLSITQSGWAARYYVL